MQAVAHEVRVLSIPAEHPYVAHITHVDSPPPPPAPPAATAAAWQPSPALDPRWVADHHREFDVVHLHFGFDHCTAEQLRAVIAELRRWRRPLVYTVHDLTNPHLGDQRRHEEHLDLLVPAADALITLTPGAAEVIRHRWGRQATVLPHPHVVPLAQIGRPRPARGRIATVGVHLKSLRAATDTTVVGVLAAICEGRDTLLRVDVHSEAMRADFSRYDALLVRHLREWHRRGRLRLVEHPRFSDAELWDYLQVIDVAVLPYRTGTHSGWVEACFDLGTAVVAPDTGFWAQQQAIRTYATGDTGPDAPSLAAALDAALAAPAARAEAADRRRQRDALANSHDRLYRAVLAART